MRKWTLALLIILMMIPLASSCHQQENNRNTEEEAYITDLAKWEIYNDGTHPVETAKGINEMLVWAAEQGIERVTMPSGTYLIDKDNSIHMVSNMTLALNDETIIQKESNAYPSYELITLGPDVHDVVLQGGIYRGDLDTHDYSSGGTHEGGYGIMLSAPRQITIDGVIAEQFTGDGLCVCQTNTLIDEFYKDDFESGEVDPDGHLIDDSSHVRITNLQAGPSKLTSHRTFQLLHQQNLPQEMRDYTAYFYREDGTFIEKIDTRDTGTPIGWDLMTAPENTAYFHIVFDIPNVPDNIYVEYRAQAVSTDITVQNSEFAYNRRQGITVGGAQQTLIVHNRIHDMKGTAPQSGIDLEAGYNINDHVTIQENEFYHNAGYDLVLYDGRNAIVEGNHFASKGAIGLALSEIFKDAKVTHNQFDGTQLYAYNDAVFQDNEMTNGLAGFLGKNLVIDGMTFKDTVINFASSEPFGIDASNITLVNTGDVSSQLGINKNPLHLKNITIEGQAALDSFAGNATDGSIFDNLKVMDYKRVQMVKGTYNDCVFRAAPGVNGPDINNAGTYVFNGCTFESDAGGLGINNIHGLPDSVTMNDSTFKLHGTNVGINISAAQEVIFTNNSIEISGISNPKRRIVSVDGPLQDFQFTGNTVSSDVQAIGLSTVQAGADAPAYVITGNVFENLTLELRPNDIQSHNQMK